MTEDQAAARDRLSALLAKSTVAGPAVREPSTVSAPPKPVNAQSPREPATASSRTQTPTPTAAPSNPHPPRAVPEAMAPFSLTEPAQKPGPAPAARQSTPSQKQRKPISPRAAAFREIRDFPLAGPVTFGRFLVGIAVMLFLIAIVVLVSRGGSDAAFAVPSDAQLVAVTTLGVTPDA